MPLLLYFLNAYLIIVSFSAIAIDTYIIARLAVQKTTVTNYHRFVLGQCLIDIFSCFFRFFSTFSVLFESVHLDLWAKFSADLFTELSFLGVLLTSVYWAHVFVSKKWFDRSAKISLSIYLILDTFVFLIIAQFNSYGYLIPIELYYKALQYIFSITVLLFVKRAPREIFSESTAKAYKRMTNALLIQTFLCTTLEIWAETIMINMDWYWEENGWWKIAVELLSNSLLPDRFPLAKAIVIWWSVRGILRPKPTPVGTNWASKCASSGYQTNNRVTSVKDDMVVAPM